jgi:hypothetical protein
VKHIGINRLYEAAANFLILDEDDLRHLDLCPDCLDVFRALLRFDKLKVDYTGRSELFNA